jgi:hypothetical protein
VGFTNDVNPSAFEQFQAVEKVPAPVSIGCYAASNSLTVSRAPTINSPTAIFTRRTNAGGRDVPNDGVESSDIIEGYQVGKGEYLEIEPEELESIAIESKRTIEIDEFVPRKEIDELYFNNPYYIVPDGEVGQQAFAVIREAIRQEGMVAIGKVVFTSREHITG